MPQRHLDRLSSTDAQFLHNESECAHMHIGALLIFDGPPPDFEQYLDHIRGRLHLIPRYRHKLAFPPLDSGRPVWVEDPTFNITYHVRHTALPAPGSEELLFRLAGRIASQPLDRSRPLWESWLVEGLEPAAPGESERFALIFKTHHALVDGVSGVDLATVLLDLERDPPPSEGELEPWRGRREPSAVELVLAGVRDALGTASGLVSTALRAGTQPARALSRLREAAEGVGEIVWAGLNPAPETPLNVEIGPHRRFVVVRQRLSDYKEVKRAFGGTVNDVVLTVVAGALARWLRARGVRTEGLELRALVPVSVRTAEDQGQLGNRLAAMRGPLPVYIEDPVARLRFVREAMDGLKESKQAVGAATLSAVESLAPPAVLAQAARMTFSTRLFNLLVTNIPGPQIPIYVLGRQLRSLLPIAFLPEHHALAIAIMSYDGELAYGLLGDYDALEDIDSLARGIDASLAELRSLARQGRREEPAEVRTSAGNGHRPAGDGRSQARLPLVPRTRSRPQRGPAADMRRRTRGNPPKRRPPEQ
jgi:diacylglycerol O-acyltransferase